MQTRPKDSRFGVTSAWKFTKPDFPPRRMPDAGRLALLMLLCFLVPSKALTDERFWFDNSTGLAIGGFDPVSYFTHVRPQLGSEKHEYVWKDVAWRFENEGNLEAFRRDPEIYAPRFGGHGSVALSTGHLTPGNPRVFLVMEGKLYLFYSASNKTVWQGMTEAQRAKAQIHWEQFSR